MKYIKLFELENSYYLFDTFSNTLAFIGDKTLDVSENNLKEIVKSARKDKVFEESYPVKFRDFSFEETKGILDSNHSEYTFNISNECNLRCKYCVYSGKYHLSRTHEKKFMSKKIALQTVDFAFENSINTSKLLLKFYGGEPLLNFNVIKAITEKALEKNKINKKKLAFSITTNGILLKGNILDYLIKNNYIIYVSLDGPKNVHDIWRVDISNEPTWEKLIKNLVNLKQKHPVFYKENMVFQSTVTPPYNLLELNNYFCNDPLFCENSVLASFVNTADLKTPFQKKSVHQNNVNKAIDFFISSILEKKISKVRYLATLWYPEIRRIHLRKQLSSSSILYPNGICIPGGKKIFVDVEGNFYPCENMDSYKIGSVSKGLDYQIIWELMKSYIGNVNKNCSNCWLRTLCNICYIYSVKKNKISARKKAEACEMKKQNIAFWLTKYLEIYDKDPTALDNLVNIYDESYSQKKIKDKL